MKMKKSILSLMLAMLMSVSTTVTVFAENQGLIKSTKENEIKVLKPTLRTVDGQEVEIPNINEITGFNSKARSKSKSFSLKNKQSAKEVADLTASVLTNYYGCTSVQYALIDNGEIVLEGSSGVYSYEGNEEVKNENMYGIASISKIYTTTAIMQLVEKGLIDLDKPVTKYVSDFKMADDRYKDITVRMLLNHSSGIMGSSLNNALLFNDNDTFAHDTLLKQLSTQRLKTDPGTYSVYCNDGFTLAEIVVERVTGNSFTSYLTNNIFNPLKLKNTKTPVSYEFNRDKLVKVYNDGSKSALPVENFNTIGTGGLYSTAEDLCKFATTFTKNSNGILSKESLKAMENKEYLNGVWPKGEDNTLGFGLGWDSVDLYPFNKYNIKALTKGGDSTCYHNISLMANIQLFQPILFRNSNIGIFYSLGIYDEVIDDDIVLHEFGFEIEMSM